MQFRFAVIFCAFAILQIKIHVVVALLHCCTQLLNYSEWKIAKVTPLFKSGDRNEPNNYRPTSVLPTIARLFERLIFKQIYSYFSENKLIYSHHSTTTALLDLLNQWCFNIDRGMVNGVLFQDLKYSFDTVDHIILLNKLNCYGVDDSTLAWFRSYLEDRQQLKCVS